jgi:hypothetical protein
VDRERRPVDFFIVRAVDTFKGIDDTIVQERGTLSHQDG